MAVTFSTNEDIRSYLEKSGHEVRSIGQAVNGLPIYCAKLGRKKTPSILITAGSHASEPGGVVGALRLLTELKTDHTVYIVPNRDPMGLEGYHRYLEYATGRKSSFASNKELAVLLKRAGEVAYEDKDLTLSVIGDFAFAAMDPSPDFLGPSEVWLRIKKLLAESDKLRARLRGKRVVTPTNMPQSEGNGYFDRAYTCVVTDDGQLKNLNRMFGTVHASQEVRCVQSLAEEIKPGLSLDLHEGFGHGFYIIIPPFNGNEAAEIIARAITRAIKAEGVRLYTLDELRSKFPDGGVYMRDRGEGILEEEVSRSDMQETLLAYATSRFGPGFGIEAGRDSTLEQRGQLHVWATLAAVKAFETHHR